MTLSLFCWTKVDLTGMAGRNRDSDFSADSAGQGASLHAGKHENLALVMVLAWCLANGSQQAVLGCFMQMARDSRQDVQE